MSPSDRMSRDARRDANMAAIEQALAVAKPGPWYFALVEESEGNVCITHGHWDVYRYEADVEVQRSEPGATVAKLEQREANVACVLADAPELHLIANAPAYLAFLLAELRASLLREAEYAKPEVEFCGTRYRLDGDDVIRYRPDGQFWEVEMHVEKVRALASLVPARAVPSPRET